MIKRFVCLTNKKILVAVICTSAFIASNQALADNGSQGKFIYKFRAQGIMTTAKKADPKSINMYNPAAAGDPTQPIYVTTPLSSKTSMGSAAGVTGSATYFISDNMAVEASLGFFRKKVKTSGVGPQYFVNNVTGNNEIYNVPFSQSTMGSFIPVTMLAQYHMAPYGKISPYVGVGYHYTVAAGSSGSNLGSSRGIVVQAGLDTWIDDNALVNLDVKKYKMTHKVRYVGSRSLSQLVPISTKLQIDPLVLSLGLGYRF